jgi:hypothetical protein
MKTEFLLRIFQHIHKCRTVEEIALAIMLQLLITGIRYLADRLSPVRTSLNFITKALGLVQSRPHILANFASSKHQYNN